MSSLILGNSQNTNKQNQKNYLDAKHDGFKLRFRGEKCPMKLAMELDKILRTITQLIFICPFFHL